MSNRGAKFGDKSQSLAEEFSAEAQAMARTALATESPSSEDVLGALTVLREAGDDVAGGILVLWSYARQATIISVVEWVSTDEALCLWFAGAREKKLSYQGEQFRFGVLLDEAARVWVAAR